MTTDMNSGNVFDTIRETIENNSVVLYMKGNKYFPRCGFSSQVASILNFLCVDFVDIDVLEDQNIREGIKRFSDWPTIPQLYIAGQFVGGSDIVREMIQAGELRQMFQEKDISFSSESMDAAENNLAQ